MSSVPSESAQNDGFDELKDNAKSAWHAASFALNITNPVYYAKKGAMYGYDKFIKGEDAGESAAE